MKLSYKLILGYLIVASIASSATYFSLQSYNNIEAAFERLMNDPVPTLKALNDLKFAGDRIIAATNAVELIYAESKNNQDPGQILLLRETEQQFVVSGQEYDKALKSYESLIDPQNESEQRSLPVIEKAGRDLIEISVQIISMKQKGIAGEEIIREKTEFAKREKLYFQAIDNARHHEYGQLSNERDTVQTNIHESTRTTLVVSILTFVLAITLGLYVSRSIARRVTKLKIASEQIGQGQFGMTVKVEANDEIGALTHSINKMAGDLQTSRTDLVSSKNFVNNIVSSIADSLIVLDMDLTVIRINQAVLHLTGFEEDELLGYSIKTLRSDGGFFNEQGLAELQLKGYVSGIETFWQTKDQRVVPILFSASIMFDSDGLANGIVCVAQDISVRKTLENQLSHQALHDSLTKLANRVLFRNRVEHALSRTERSSQLVAVMFLDLDDFKSVNDTLGHEAGDTLLISVAERLMACLRPSDTVARLGGDEFAVLIENVNHPEEVTFIAERLNDVLRESFLLAGKEMFVQTSIGIVFSNAKRENIDDLLRNADVAMYKAKSQGKDRYVIFEDKMREDMMARVEFEADLRRAIEQKEFVVHYQPIINLHSEQITGMEALVRWNHPRHGLIPPLEFIPIAEETNLIIPLGQWVLEEACRQARYWQTKHIDKKNLSVTVNLSNKQVQEENLVEQVAFALIQSNLPAQNLILEITESTMLQNSEATIKKLTGLKNLGVKLAIDDFGTGYSSLSYLQQFPVDVLKIDKSFIDKINQGTGGAAVTRAIITMSETLHLKTIAEGIETGEQNTTLQNLGCEFGQGYHFSRPLTKEAMDEFLTRYNLEEQLNFLDSQTEMGVTIVSESVS